LLYVAAIRSIVGFLALFLLSHVMGKKQVAQFTLFDYIVGITIGSIAATMSVDIGVEPPVGLVALATWAFAAVFFGWLTLKGTYIEKLLNGEPTILIKDGKIQEKNMGTARYSLADLLMQLRQNDAFNLADVEVAILEQNGELSVLKKADAEPVTPRTLGIAVASQVMPSVVIQNGQVMNDTLEHLGHDEDWLKEALKQQGVNDFNSVMLAQVGGYDELYVDLRDDKGGVYPPNQRKKLAADLDALEADLYTFALQTDDFKAKRLFERLAGRIHLSRKRVVPLILR